MPSLGPASDLSVRSPTRPTQIAAPVAEIALTPEEQIAAEVAKFEEQRAKCGTSACRDTVTQWESAAVKKIKKKAGIPLDAPAPKAYPTPKRVAPAPVAETEAAPAPAAAPEATSQPAPRAAAGPPVDAKADAKARLAERQAASAAAAEKAAAEKAAKAEALRQAQADAQAERVAAAKAAAEAAEAKRAAAAAAKADAKADAKPAPAPAPAKKAAPAPPPAKKAAPAPAKKTTAKPKSPGVFDYVVGDVTVAALGSAAALALVAPSFKDKALAGDASGALEEVKGLVTGANQDAAIGKACLLGGVVTADALIHLPVLGFFLPSPAEFVGTVAATLLAAKYFVTREASYEEDIKDFAASIPAGVPDVASTVVEPITKFVGAVKAPDADVIVGDFNEWFNGEFILIFVWAIRLTWFFLTGLDDPVEEIAPKAAAFGACVAVSYVAHFPVLGLVLPRVLELVGVYVCGGAVAKYGEAGSVSLKADLIKVGDDAGAIVKSVVSK